MPDLTTISTVLGSIKSATDIAKLIKDGGLSLEKAEVKLQIAELINALADAKIEAAGIQSELVEKDNKIKELKEHLEQKKSVIWEKPYYWIKNGDDMDGPFCQCCYDTERKLIRLQEDGEYQWVCCACNKEFKEVGYERPRTVVDIF